jgi:hypothetical protein
LTKGNALATLVIVGKIALTEEYAGGGTARVLSQSALLFGLFERAKRGVQ